MTHHRSVALAEEDVDDCRLPTKQFFSEQHPFVAYGPKRADLLGPDMTVVAKDQNVTGRARIELAGFTPRSPAMLQYTGRNSNVKTMGLIDPA